MRRVYSSFLAIVLACYDFFGEEFNDIPDKGDGHDVAHRQTQERMQGVAQRERLHKEVDRTMQHNHHYLE